VQRVIVVGSIVWLIMMMYKNKTSSYQFENVMFHGLIPVVLVWGAYWIIIGIIEKRKNK
jgi:heme/copper-type cytochrome/quinol oxidase subunit 4